MEACHIPLERYFQYLSNGIKHAPKFSKLQLANPKKICSRLVTADQGGQTPISNTLRAPELHPDSEASPRKKVKKNKIHKKPKLYRVLEIGVGSNLG
jgi:hypothetical protein